MAHHGREGEDIFADIDRRERSPAKAEPAPQVLAAAPLATGAKFDGGKPPMALLPPAALAAVARVLGKGAEKYVPHNWRKGIAHSRTIGAALRHVFAYLDGEDLDDKPDAKGNPGTGENHLACAACELLFALQFDEEGKRGFLDADGRAQVIDDRHRTVKP